MIATLHRTVSTNVEQHLYRLEVWVDNQWKPVFEPEFLPTKHGKIKNGLRLHKTTVLAPNRKQARRMMGLTINMLTLFNVHWRMDRLDNKPPKETDTTSR